MSRSWHPLFLDGATIETIQAGRQTQVRKLINRDHLRFLDLSTPEGRGVLLLRCPYGGIGHTLWSKETRDQHESGARLWLTVERITVQRVQEMTDEEIRAEWAGNDFYPYEQLRRDWREEWDRRHPRKSENWVDNPFLWAISFGIKPRW